MAGKRSICVAWENEKASREIVVKIAYTDEEWEVCRVVCVTLFDRFDNVVVEKELLRGSIEERAYRRWFEKQCDDRMVGHGRRYKWDFAARKTVWFHVGDQIDDMVCYKIAAAERELDKGAYWSNQYLKSDRT